MRLGFKTRLAAGITAVLLAVVVCLLLLLHTDPVKRRTLDKVRSLLHAQGIDFQASRLSYNLFFFSVALDDVEITSTSSAHLPPAAQAERVTVSMRPWDLLNGSIRIRSAVLTKPRLHLVIDERGNDNLPKIPEGESKGRTDFLIESLRTPGASLRIDDRRRDFSLDLPDWSLSVDGDPASWVQNIRLHLGLPGTISFEERTLPIHALFADVLLKRDELEVRSLTLQAADTRMVLGGTIQDLADPSLDLSLTGDVTLGRLLTFLGIEQRVSGNVSMEIAAKGRLPSLTVASKISSTSIGMAGFERLRVAMESVYRASEDRLRVESLSVGMPTGSLEASADVALKPEAGRSNLTARVNGLDLERMSRLLSLPVRVASRVDGTVRAEWLGLEYEDASGDALVRMSPLSGRASKNVLPVAASLSASGRRRSVAIKVHSLDALGTHTEGAVTLASLKGLGGELRTTVADLKGAAAAAAAFEGQERFTDADFSGSAHLTTSLGGTVDAPKVAAALSAPNLRVGELNGVDLSANASYDPAKVVIENAALRWSGQEVTASGTVGLAAKSPLLALSAEMNDASIADILAGLGKKDIPASGTLSAAATMNGTVENPQGSFILTGSGLHAYGEPVGQLSAEAGLEGELLTLTRLRLDKPAPAGSEAGDTGGVLEANGTFDLSSRLYKVDAKGEQLRIAQLTLPGGGVVSGELNLDAAGAGSIQDPKLALNLDLNRLRLDDAEFGSLTAKAQLAGEEAQFEIGAPKFNLTATGTAGTAAPYPARVQLQAKGTDLASLPLKIDQRAAGTITADIRGSGNLSEWQKGEASASIGALELTWNGQPVRSDGPIEADFTAGTLNVRRAAILAGTSRLLVDGSMPLEESAAPGAIRIQGTFDLENLLAFVPEKLDFTAKGLLNLEAALAGSLRRMSPTASLTLQDGSLSAPDFNPPVSNVALDLQLQDGTVLLNRASAEWASGTLQASGEFPLGLLPDDLPVQFARKEAPALLALEVKGVDLAAIQGTPEQVSGTVSLRAEAEAAELAPKAVRGTVTFDDMQLNLADFRMKQNTPGVISIQDGTARVEQFDLRGPETRLQVSGTAGFDEAPSLDIRAEGKMDAAVLALFAEDVRAQGPTRLELAVKGPAKAPEITGFLEVDGGQLSIAAADVRAENLDVRLELTGDKVSIAKLRGSVNGGRLSGRGGASFGGGELKNVNVELDARNIYLNFPEGLKTVSNARITALSRDSQIVLGGKVDVLEGSFQDDLTLEAGLLRYLRSGQSVELSEERSPLLSRLRFDVGVETGSPIILDNNLARLALMMYLRVVGSYYRPSLTGRLQIEEGGELFLNERTYLVDRGVITFINSQRIQPSLDILAQTKVSNYDITLQVAGEMGDIKTTLRSESDPELTEPELLALLLTGRRDISGAQANIARDQMLSYFAGSFTGKLTRQAERALGLSQVRLEPNLIAAESDPSARLTVGQDFTKDFSLIYSMNLADSGDQIWIAEYDITKRFVTRGIKQNDNSYRMEFRHHLAFGGPAGAGSVSRPREKRQIGSITFSGNSLFTDEQLLARMKVKPGKEYDFFKIRKGLDRLEDFYAGRNLLESRVRMDRRLRRSTVDVNVAVEAGPEVEFVYEGWNPSSSVRGQIREIWADGVFDAQRADEASASLRAALVKEQYLDSKIEYAITTPSTDRKRVFFEIQPGIKYRNVKLEFPGAEEIGPKELEGLLEDQKLLIDVYTNPAKVSDFLLRYYRDRGFLDAKLETPRQTLDPETGTGSVSITVSEGPRFRVGGLRFTGQDVYPEDELRQAIPLREGRIYEPEVREESFNKLQDLFFEKGYNDVEINYELKKDSAKGLVDLTFQIQENRKRVVTDVRVEGTHKTSESLVLGQLQVRKGDVLNNEKISQARRNLYDTGAYSVVEIQAVPGERNADLAADQEPVVLVATVRELRPYDFRYGGFYDTDRGPGFIADLSNRNSLGAARVLGLRTRYDSDIREARLYFSQPVVADFPLRSSVVGFVRRELREAFIADRTGFSMQQEMHFKRHYMLTYGYRFERTHTFDRVPDEFFPFDVTLRVAPLTTSFIRETRDDLLEATRGSFTSHSLEYAPASLGSQLRFVRYFGQYFKYLPLSKPVEVPFSNVMRPRLVFATGVRVGLAAGLGGQSLVPSERFFAGGGTTIRGFEQDRVGPIDEVGPLGGNALFVMNNELRFPLFKMFDGVAFADIGNVYPTVADFNPFEVRKTAGLGLRIRTPYFLLRFDYGFKLDKKPGEIPGKFFFSIGQAF